MAFTTYGKNKVNDHLTKKTAWTPAGAYVVLSTADIAADQSGLTEPGDTYARVASSGATWNASANGTLTNAAEVAFAIGTGSWGTITHFGLAETNVKTTTDVYIYNALDASKAVTTDQYLRFPAGTLTLTAS